MMAEAVADGAGATEAAPEAQNGGGLDLGPLMERFDGMSGRMEQLETSLLERLGGGEETETDDGEFDLNDLFGEPDAETGQHAFDPAVIQQLVQAEAQKLIEAQMGPVRDQVRNIQVGLDAEQLVAKYPDLNDAAVAGPVVEGARALAESVGNPDLAQDPRIVELVYKAQRADRHAAGERPAGAEQGFELERAGGAGPAAVEPDIAARIIASHKAQSPWDRWK